MFKRILNAFRARSAGGGTWRTVMNAWQIGLDRPTQEYTRFAPVYACIRIIAEEVARTPWYIVREDADGRKRRVMDTDAAHALKKPNPYQTASDFKLQLTYNLLFSGNGPGFTMLNERGGVAGLYNVPWSSIQPHIDPRDGSVYYHVSHSDVMSLANAEEGYWFPSRRVFHVRLFTPLHPLKGETPLTAAAYGVDTGLSIGAHTSAFFTNMARPSGVLETAEKLSPEQVASIKEQFVQSATRGQSGAPVVLHSGLAWKAQTMTAVDAEVIKTYNLSERAVAQIFRVPPYLLGDLEDAKFSSVSELMRYFVLNGLGFYFEHIAQHFTALLRLAPNENVEFDVETAMLRGDMLTRMEAYGKATQAGLSVNEVRAKEGLPPVEGGEIVRLQAQMVPINMPQPEQPSKALLRHRIAKDIAKRMAA
jgi:HK97 family phage portal protein